MDNVEILGGPAQEYMSIMGADPAADIVTMLGASSPKDVMCAEQVKGAIYGAAGCTAGTLGLGLFGVYKLFKGKPAAGVTGLVAGGIVLWIGRALATSAALRFKNCQAGGPTGIT